MNGHMLLDTANLYFVFLELPYIFMSCYLLLHVTKFITLTTCVATLLK